MTLMIEGIEVECIIGDLPEEREREQTLVVDAELEIPDRAAETDALADTVDYAAAAESHATTRLAPSRSLHASPPLRGKSPAASMTVSPRLIRLSPIRAEARPAAP